MTICDNKLEHFESSNEYSALAFSRRNLSQWETSQDQQDRVTRLLKRELDDLNHKREEFFQLVVQVHPSSVFEFRRHFKHSKA